MLLDRCQQFQDVAESLRTWLRESEEAVANLLSESVSSDPAVLQGQLASAKVSKQTRFSVLILGSGWLVFCPLPGSIFTEAKVYSKQLSSNAFLLTVSPFELHFLTCLRQALACAACEVLLEECF